MCFEDRMIALFFFLIHFSIYPAECQSIGNTPGRTVYAIPASPVLAIPAKPYQRDSSDEDIAFSEKEIAAVKAYRQVFEEDLFDME